MAYVMDSGRSLTKEEIEKIKNEITPVEKISSKYIRNTEWYISADVDKNCRIRKEKTNESV